MQLKPLGHLVGYFTKVGNVNEILHRRARQTSPTTPGAMAADAAWAVLLAEQPRILEDDE